MKKPQYNAARIGSLILGKNWPVRVQTMLEKPVYRITAGFRARLKLLEELGCDMIRFALPDKESIEVLSKIRTLTGMPIIADIHFDYKMALDIMPRVDKIRINPGNIGADWNVKEIHSAL